MSENVYIGIGSNLKNPREQVELARQQLAELEQTVFITSSSLYQTPSLANTLDSSLAQQPDYVNCVVLLQTTLSPLALLQQLWRIEQQQGRIRLERWGPRTIDLDILLYGDHIINTTDLIIPHPGLKEREFVLYPLAEITPQLQLPSGESITLLKDQLFHQHNSTRGICKI